MQIVGIIVLIQPALMCLMLSVALIITGLVWFLWLRHLERRLFQCLAAFAAACVFFTVFALSIYYKYGITPIQLETIVSLEPGFR